MAERFDYGEAFSRNIGWVTADEQQILRSKRVAIAGLGGVGGVHLLTLTRLGIGAFNLADFDRFSLANFNRQAGASMSTLHHPKVDVMAAQARDINPELDLRLFPEGVNADNLDAFLEDVDLYVDGLDFFAFEAREATFAACSRLGIPAVTAAPLGMGTSVLNFLPGGMTFEEYFRWRGLPEPEKALRFLIGLSPAMLQRAYLADPAAVDLSARRGPSTVMACQICAGIAATEALKILLGRGRVLAAPRGMHFDAYRNRMVHTWRPWGNANPLQRLTLAVARRQLGRMAAAAPPRAEGGEKRIVECILEVARWAPSGDNTQPWRFEIRSDDHVVVHGFDTRDHVVYDLQGRPSQISLGALLETLRIAATAHGLRVQIVRRTEAPEHAPIFDVFLRPDSTVAADPLLPFVKLRSVQRRAMRMRPLTEREKSALTASVGPGYLIKWIEGWGPKWTMARLLWMNGKLRLTMPEAYRVHRDVIQRNAQFSEDRIPDRSVGLDPLTTRLMHWVMGSWARVAFFNKFLGGTILPRIELDLWPALACGAHFLIVPQHEPQDIDDFIAAGGAVQRFWLTATRLGLQLQPEITPLIFARYARERIPLTRDAALAREALALAQRLDRLAGEQTVRKAVFMGRLGWGRRARARSLRLPLSKLIK
ncbi:MAG: ThiF family adenylyltransferase [Pseudomonadota bacterium]